ncbi:unnamed protein product [Lasius platythorax]|uniref:Uncharacterized protein n=1 Tax=Lasius platythorax TaxID=488582 RepID=A0AAV2MYJ3_9HYME
MRVDKFVASHLNYLDGRLRLDYAANAFPTSPDFETSPKQDEINVHESTSNSNIDEVTDNSVTNNQIDTISTDDSHSIKDYSKISDSLSSNETCPLNFQENWMGLTERPKKSHIKKESYLDKCPEWDSIESQNIVFIPIMKNGNGCQPIKLKGETIMVRNTCAFDAFLHCTVHMIGI